VEIDNCNCIYQNYHRVC